ncbi:poly-beta-1,6-N-acetyl-D-glucosamine biosynthesis protein PgaD [Marinobacter daepoensis]|uniref:Poly-beta-1,6-N-acetyl-D-glucosamine biosynthesis protein PgaD n=1 Tax=Marinobacter daepoensis TaxID=262077 RepID=A0ABS3BEH9_9GAMM|nr:poly-beta-1,6-N-acetyl-D-glucosamine biosynthesis protein PgaD [Marinobacter daepoensis]MBN7769750.1 poly-beta-1,6-N-acetyl-D-glucosamine biosynthesis protein PgaD [Marinobacter daepoensis]MBY6078440.1 poly-beta-1,6-N-acetyl-D-glucosamine biosynthesis protein PgaD [Marinobacter daepoensis]
MMLIQTKQHWFPRLLGNIFTLIAWAVFAFLMIDGVNTLLHEGHRPKEFALPGEFFSTLHSLLWYLLMAAMLSAVLLGWAKYSERRAARYQRRKPIPDMTDTQLASSFGVSLPILKMMQQEQILILFNNSNGTLARASFVRQGVAEMDLKSGWPQLPPERQVA